MQASGRSRFPHRRSLQTRGAGEVDSTRTSEYAAPVVGAAAVGFVAGGVAGVAAADPCDAHCPEDFKQQAREILRAVRQPPANDSELRQGLLSFIANFANWDNTADRTHLNVSRRW